MTVIEGSEPQRSEDADQLVSRVNLRGDAQEGPPPSIYRIFMGVSGCLPQKRAPVILRWF